MKSLHRNLVTTLAALLCATAAHASLIGHQITGSLFNAFDPDFNFFDPANGRVPADTLNIAGTTVTVGASATEFGTLTETASFSFRLTADFSANNLLIRLLITGNRFGLDPNPLGLQFTSLDAGLFQGISRVSDSFGPNMRFSLSGDAIKLTWDGDFVEGPAEFSANFAIQNNGVPEPASLALTSLALAAACLARRRYGQAHQSKP